MTLPVRFTVCTYNIWAWDRWPERAAALRRFVDLHTPDVLCLQELQADSRAVLDQGLGLTHARIDDPFAGWTSEGTIYWNRALFDEVEHGAEPAGIIEPLRRLFWVRLALRDGSGRSLLVSTAHFTWFGHEEARETDRNVRILQARATVAALDRLARPDTPQLFMGDLNEANQPVIVLRGGGFVDCFAALGRLPRVTTPASPTASGPPSTLDWLLHRGPIRPLTAEVVDFFDGDIAPSDHKPVLATYTW